MSSSINPYLSKFIRIPQSEAEKAEQLQAYNQCKHLISSLPSHNGCLRLYNGIYFQEDDLLNFLLCQRYFKADPTDIILATYPKSGTTWLKAMTFAILNRRPHSNLRDHPLLTLHPQECIPHLEVHFTTSHVVPADDLPTPRAIGTHIPYSLLPTSVRDLGCRIVYLCRDPKDTLVSLWHFSKKVMRRTEKDDAARNNLTLEELSDQFCSGTVRVVGCGSVWDHWMEYWRASQEQPEKVLFLKYEDMLQRPEECARKLAEFIGRPFSDEEEKGGVVADIVKLCSIDFLKSLDANRDGPLDVSRDWIVDKSAFFRNGKAGGWKEELSPEIAQRLDKITREKACELN